MQLVPFNSFHGHIALIPVCRRCYIYAISNFDLVQVNALSARATTIDPAAIALAGLARFPPMVNAVGHHMYEDLYPVAPREGRTLVLIERHHARVGTPTRMPVLHVGCQRFSFLSRDVMTNVNLILRSNFTSHTSSQLVLLIRRGKQRLFPDSTQLLCNTHLSC
jgi:hypothetical protein